MDDQEVNKYAHIGSATEVAQALTGRGNGNGKKKKRPRNARLNSFERNGTTTPQESVLQQNCDITAALPQRPIPAALL